MTRARELITRGALVLRLRLVPSPAVGRQRRECMQRRRREHFHAEVRPQGNRARSGNGLVAALLQESGRPRQLAARGLDRRPCARKLLSCRSQIDRLARRRVTLSGWCGFDVSNRN